MQTNILSNEEVNERVQEIIKYLSANPYGAVEAEINDAPCIVIAAVESQEMESVNPLFIIPSPELILHVVDPDDKKALFAITLPNMN